MRRLARNVALVLALAILAIVPAMLGPSTIGILTQMLISSLFALAYSLLSGQAGLLSFGHAAFFGTGAFAAIHAMAAAKAGTLPIPMPLLPLVGGFAGFVVGLIAGYFATLRTGIYFSMITLALAELIYSIAPSLEPIFGGEGGLSSSRVEWLGISFYSDLQNYYLVLAWVTVCAAALYLYTFTPLGRITVALRENEKRVAFIGFDVHATKVLVFALSAMFSSIAGSLWAITLERANYTVFGLETSANVVLGTFIGGATTFFGPALGAIGLTLFQTVVSDYSRQWLLYEGMVFIAIMLFAPQGLVLLVAAKINHFRLGDAKAKIGVAIEVVLAVLTANFIYLLTEAVAGFLSSGRSTAVGTYWWLLASATLAVVVLAIKMKALDDTRTNVSRLAGEIDR